MVKVAMIFRLPRGLKLEQQDLHKRLEGIQNSLESYKKSTEKRNCYKN